MTGAVKVPDRREKLFPPFLIARGLCSRAFLVVPISIPEISAGTPLLQHLVSQHAAGL